MQTITFSSIDVKAEFPDNVLWTGDDNFVIFTQTSGYTMKVTLEVLINGNLYYLKYQGENGAITMRLNDLLRAFAPCSFKMAATVTVYGITEQDSLGDHVIYYGKSLAERYHGSATIITYNDTSLLNQLEFYNLFSNEDNPTQTQILPNHDISTVVSPIGISQHYCANSSRVIIRRTSGYTPATITIGELWNCSDLSVHTYCLKKVCPQRNGIELRYYDTDGCLRAAIGEVLNKKMKVEREEYLRQNSLINSVPRSVVTTYSGTIEVGFADVEPEQYIEDIMLSPIITELNTGAELTPETLELDRDGETKDIIITFRIN